MPTASNCSSRAGHLVVELCKRYYEEQDSSILPRSMGFKAFENAMALDIAMGGSTNTILHILAIAQEAEIDFTMADIDRMSKIVPQLLQSGAPTRTSTTWKTCTAPAASWVFWASSIARAVYTRDLATVHSKTMKRRASTSWDIARNPSEAVKTFYMAGPGGMPTQVAFSQAARWPSLDTDRANGCIRSVEHAIQQRRRAGGAGMATLRSMAVSSKPRAWMTACWCSKVLPTWWSRKTRRSSQHPGGQGGGG